MYINIIHGKKESFSVYPDSGLERNRNIIMSGWWGRISFFYIFFSVSGMRGPMLSHCHRCVPFDPLGKLCLRSKVPLFNFSRSDRFITTTAHPALFRATKALREVFRGLIENFDRDKGRKSPRHLSFPIPGVFSPQE